MANQDKIGEHATTVEEKNGVLVVKYHSTNVVTYNYNTGKIILDTGGWKSNTTKTRMNQCSNQYGLRFCVYQKDYIWYVEYRNKTYIFEGDKLELN